VYAFSIHVQCWEWTRQCKASRQVLTNTVHSRQSVVTWSYSLMVRERAPVGDSLPLKLRLVPVYTTTHANNNVRRGVDHGVEGVLTPWKYVGGVRVCFDPRKNVIFLHSKLLLDNSVVSHHQGWKTCVKHMEGKKNWIFWGPWNSLMVWTNYPDHSYFTTYVRHWQRVRCLLRNHENVKLGATWRIKLKHAITTVKRQIRRSLNYEQVYAS